MNIDISVDSGQWSAVENPETLVAAAVEAVLAELPGPDPGNVELSVALVSDDAIRTLNRDYRGRDKATNVLSFPCGEPAGPGLPRLLGDVVLAFETVSRESEMQGKPVEHRVSHLVVHGFLHLLGYDHESSGEAEAMEAIEIRALARLDIADPYLDMTEPVNHEAAGGIGARR